MSSCFVAFILPMFTDTINGIISISVFSYILLSVIFVGLLNIFPGVYLLSRIFSHFFSMFL